MAECMMEMWQVKKNIYKKYDICNVLLKIKVIDTTPKINVYDLEA